MSLLGLVVVDIRLVGTSGFVFVYVTFYIYVNGGYCRNIVFPEASATRFSELLSSTEFEAFVSALKHPFHFCWLSSEDYIKLNTE